MAPDAETSHLDDPDVLDVEAEPSTALAVIETDLAELKAQVAAQLEASQVMTQFQADMRKMVAAKARPNHWPRFGDRVRPDGSECLRLRMLFGVDIDIPEIPQRYDYTDEGGSYYVYACRGTASCGPITVPCYGSASSRNKFFAVSHGERRPIEEINPSYISKMSWMETIKNGIVMLFGLDLDPDELAGITGKETRGDTARTFDRNADRSGKDTPEVADKRQWVGDRIMELASGDVPSAQQFLCKLTTFKGRSGNWVKGKTSCKALTDKQVANLYKWREKNLTPQAFAEFITDQKGV